MRASGWNEPGLMDYSGVALTPPVSFGYTRASPHRVPWFFAGALRALLERSGVGHDEVDGLVIASYRLAPDNAASLV